jgi:hypothetical protein
MLVEPCRPNRREFMGSAIALAGTGLTLRPTHDRALISITLDLEMSRHYPTHDQMHWDYEKGNLDDATKRYTVEAARRVKQHQGRIHFFALGQTMEQVDVKWLESIAEDGHPIGNHTYDHVNIKATRLDDVQFRFKRAPWLVEGRTPTAVITENIKMARSAFKSRLGIETAGFRTPGGFHGGISERLDLQLMLLRLGYTWVSSLYPPHPSGQVGTPPSREVINAIVSAQAKAQPFAYPTGLIEVPMSPISDVSAFRSAKWKLDAFLEALERSVTWAIENRRVFDFLAHPSCLVVEDPEFKSIELICELVRKAGDRASLVDLGTIAESVMPAPPKAI